jgi:hypothetical protein
MVENAIHGHEPVPNENHGRTLMVLGKNIGEEWTGKRIRETRHHLSPHSRVSVLAAGVALKEGLADNVIFTVGNTAGPEPLTPEEAQKSGNPNLAGSTLPSEAELMASHFKRIFPSLADKVKTQPRSWDTNTDAKEAKELIKSQALGRDFKLMTTGFHRKRARFLFNRQGLHPAVLASENILESRRPKFVKEYRASKLYKKETRKEKIAYMIQRVPFVVDLMTLITKRSRMKNTDTQAEVVSATFTTPALATAAAH